MRQEYDLGQGRRLVIRKEKFNVNRRVLTIFLNDAESEFTFNYLNNNIERFLYINLSSRAYKQIRVNSYREARTIVLKLIFQT